MVRLSFRHLAIGSNEHLPDKSAKECSKFYFKRLKNLQNISNNLNKVVKIRQIWSLWL